MPYRQSLERCFAAAIGDRGLSAPAWEAALERAAVAMATVRRWHDDESLPLLRLPRRRDDLAACRAAAEVLTRGASDIVHFGTGGSSLGAQALAQLAGYRVPGSRLTLGLDERPALHFFDNLDAATLTEALGNLDFRTTRFLVVSKSGGTPETVVQLIATLDALTAEGLDRNAARHIVVLTEPADPARNPARSLAARYGLTVLDHDPRVGGRFSVLSNVGMLPALLLGLDPEAIRAGAAEVMAAFLTGDDPAAIAPVAGAAMVQGLTEERGLAATILMPYSDRLRLLSAWYQQLWAESLGKDGLGTQPVAAAGPVDQHSQMQLFLGGPADKLLTIIMGTTAGSGPRVSADLRADPLLGYLAGRTVGDLTDAQARANAETYAGHGRPVRVMTIDRVDERTTGALLMHFMIETIVTGLMMGIDPFDQPAVEAAKVLTRDYLAAM
jgi:glucose-6-phosphate isomerase